MAVTRTSLALLVLGLLAIAGPRPSAAQGSEIAYVESVSGRVLAMIQGKPTLLDTLDVIEERTRLDLLANRELRLCHYRSEKIITLKGPMRGSVTSSGVAVENGKEIEGSGESCVKPTVSSFQGGFVARTAGVTATKVPVRPTIKIVNRTKNGIRNIALWDSDQRRIVAVFEHNAAQPVLNEGQNYLLVVGRNDGSELKMLLQASPLAADRPLILVVR